MKKSVISICLLWILSSVMYAQLDSKVIYTCDQSIPSYYVFSERGGTFYRNDKADDITRQLNTLLKLNSETTLELVDTLTDIVKGYHETYQQYYKGVEVDGKQCSVHYASDGQVEMINGNLLTINGLDVIPAKKMSDAKTLAVEALKTSLQKKGNGVSSDIWKSINIDSVATYKQAKLVVYIKDDIPYLAYKYMLSSSIIELNQCVYINANNGDVLDVHSTICSITANAASLYSDTVSIVTDYNSNTYRLRDATRGNGIETKRFLGAPIYYGGYDYANSYGDYYTSSDNTWTNLSYFDRAAIDVHWGIEKTYDFYLDKFGRNSYDNRGSTIISYVNAWDYENQRYLQNSMWTGSNMVYGRWTYDKAMVSIDVTAHELTHGFTNSSSNLQNTSEGGAINEGISDVFATCVEKEYKPNKGDSIWLCGEDFYTNPRSMSNPACKYYHGTGWANTNNLTSDNGGVHTNSGVFSYWFYLLVNGRNDTNEGGFHYNVDSIGFDKAIQICYLANATYLRSNHNYTDARYCTLYAAQHLNFGANVLNQVANAWDAVGVYESIAGSSVIYNSANYWTATVPDSCSVSWFLTGDNASNFILQSSNSSSHNCTMTRSEGTEFSGSSYLTLNAIVMYNGTPIDTLSKQLIAPYIEGPTVPCGITAYYVYSLPANAAVAWYADGQNLNEYTAPGGQQPVPYTYVINPGSNDYANGTLTATVMAGNNVLGVLDKFVDTTGGFSGTWYQQATLNDTINSTPKPFLHNSLLEFVPNRTVYLSSDHFNNATISHSESGVFLSGWSNSNGVISFNPVQPINYTGSSSILIEGTAQSGCKKFRLRLFSPPSLIDDPILLAKNPNGSTYEFSISEDVRSRQEGSSESNNPLEWRLTIIKIDSANRIFDEMVRASSISVNVSGWPRGIYIAIAQIKDQYYSLKFSVGE